MEQLVSFWANKALLEQSSYYGKLRTRENNNIMGVRKIDWDKLDETGKREYAEYRTINGHNKHVKHTDSHDENSSILHDMIGLLYDHEIKPYVFITPYTSYYNELIHPGYKPDILETLNQLEWPIEFLDMNDYSDNFDDSDFIDSDHLNLKGAHKATALLDGYIQIAEGK